MGNQLIEKKATSGPFKIVIETMQSGVERYYFWILRFLKERAPHGQGFEEVVKLRDIMASSEASSFFGNIEQRKSVQQKDVGQWLGALSQMTTQLHQILHELRILDQRNDLYERDDKGEKSADTALKQVWLDMVDGGQNNPSGLFNLAHKFGYATLPDLFFATYVEKGQKIDDIIKDLETNERVKSVLANKLEQYYTWKRTTAQEIKQRKNFTLKQLRVHYNTMRMYISWVRPYLQNLEFLQQQRIKIDPDLVSAFDSSKIELEILALDKSGYKKYYPAVLVKFKYVAMPQMSFQQEYQKGAIHTGRSEISIEGYIVTDEDVKGYQEKEEMEDFEVIKALELSMEALEEDLRKFLIEAKEIEEEKKDEEKKETIAGGVNELFSGIGEGFRDMFAWIRIFKRKKKKEGLTSKEEDDDKAKAKKGLGERPYLTYKIFKKSHGMATE